jgi:hypothetical protein
MKIIDNVEPEAHLKNNPCIQTGCLINGEIRVMLDGIGIVLN